jgi:DNA-binding transcriptional MerR regulator
MPAQEVVRMPSARRLYAVQTSSTIAQVATLAGVTFRALRYYEEVGLLSPGRDRSGTRLFDRRQCDKAIMIARLRRMDLSLADIRWFLDVETSDEGRRRFLDRALNEQLTRLRGKYAEVQSMVDQLASADLGSLSAA